MRVNGRDWQRPLTLLLWLALAVAGAAVVVWLLSLAV